MACDQETRILISTYADGEATPEDAARASEHLQSCPGCRKMLEDWEGQRQLLEWAYTLELPDLVMPRATEEGTMSEPVSIPERRSISLRFRWSWKPALAAAAAVILLAAVYFATPYRYPLLETSKRLVTTAGPETVRLNGRVTLTIGPGSIVTRTGEKTVKLDKGWIEASVRHGSGLNVITRRLKVRDIGTVFHVTSGDQFDCVTVEQGRVEVLTLDARWGVEPGQAVFVDTHGRSSVAGTMPADTEERPGMLLADAGKDFSPATADSLDWDEGAERLAKVFPDARWDGGWVGGPGTYDGVQYRSSLGAASGLISAVRAHYGEIARAAAGGAPDGMWQIPVGYLYLSGVNGRTRLREDFYYLRLISDGLHVRWTLIGSRGDRAEFPMEMAELPDLGSRGSLSNLLEYAQGRVRGEEQMVVVRLRCWPGELKPALRLKLAGIPVAEAEQDQREMLSQALAELPGQLATSTPKLEPVVCYLDRSREHRMLVAWNSLAGTDYYHAMDAVNEGKAARAFLGLIHTDVDWLEPRLSRGTHMIWWTMRPGDKRPHLEVSSDAQFSSRVPLPGRTKRFGSGSSSRSPEVPKGRPPLIVRMGDPIGDGNGYRFWLDIGPESKDGEGEVSYIKIAKP